VSACGIRSFCSGHHTGGDRATISRRLFDDRSGFAEFLGALCIHLHNRFLQTGAIQVLYGYVRRRYPCCWISVREVSAGSEGSPNIPLKVPEFSTWHEIIFTRDSERSLASLLEYGRDFHGIWSHCDTRCLTLAWSFRQRYYSALNARTVHQSQIR
jgi:hypothetical protein